MDKKAVVAIAERFVCELQARCIRPQQVFLYGPQAAGTATEASDIDVVVVSESFSGKSCWERIEVLTEAIYAVYAPVEAVAKKTIETIEGSLLHISLYGKCRRDPSRYSHRLRNPCRAFM